MASLRGVPPQSNAFHTFWGGSRLTPFCDGQSGISLTLGLCGGERAVTQRSGGNGETTTESQAELCA